MWGGLNVRGALSGALCASQGYSRKSPFHKKAAKNRYREVSPMISAKSEVRHGRRW